MEDELGLSLDDEVDPVDLPDELGLPGDLALSEDPQSPSKSEPEAAAAAELIPPEETTGVEQAKSPASTKRPGPPKVPALDLSSSNKDREAPVGDTPRTQARKEKDAQAARSTPRSLLSPRPAPSPRPGLSPRSALSPRSRSGAAAHDPYIAQAMQAHLFGGKDAVKAMSTKAPLSKLERQEVMARIQAPKKNRPVEPDANCTFRPNISEKSRELAGTDDEQPRWMTLAESNKEKEEKLQQKSAAAAEEEMSHCTFKPDIGDVARFANVQPKFREAGYERFQNQKKLVERRAIEEEAAKQESNSGPSSPRRSPRRGPSRESPTSTAFNRGGYPPVAPANSFRHLEDAPGSSRGEAAHIARAKAAREQRAAREAAFSKMGQACGPQWQSRRSTTTPVPFCSHTGIRIHQRSLREHKDVENMHESEKVYKELHEQLHSLQLGGLH